MGHPLWLLDKKKDKELINVLIIGAFVCLFLYVGAGLWKLYYSLALANHILSALTLSTPATPNAAH